MRHAEGEVDGSAEEEVEDDFACLDDLVEDAALVLLAGGLYCEAV